MQLITFNMFNISAQDYKLTNVKREVSIKRKINLNSGLLKLVDGKPGLMDQYCVRDIMYIGRELTKLQLGIETTSKKRIGKYKFNGRLYTLKELVKLEEKLIKAKDTKAVEQLFYMVGSDFRDITRPYLLKARENKSITLKIISNYCKVANRTESYLLKWGEGSGNEKELFLKYVKTLKDIDIFCTDLLNFLVTLVHNCPKGYAKYIEWKNSLSK